MDEYLNKARVEEYNSLRQEIIHKDVQFHDYKRNAFNVTAAILAFSLTNCEPFICLIPIGIIIPLYLLSQDSLRVMLKLGAYLRVYYDEEGFSWERRNMLFSWKIMDEENIRKRNRLIYDESMFLFLVLMCGFLSAYKSLENQYTSSELAFHIIIIVVVVLISFFIISKQEVHTTLLREHYIELWEDVRSSEEKLSL